MLDSLKNSGGADKITALAPVPALPTQSSPLRPHTLLYLPSDPCTRLCLLLIFHPLEYLRQYFISFVSCYTCGARDSAWHRAGPQ